MDDVFLSFFYKIAAEIERNYDVDGECFDECAAIAQELAEKAKAEYLKQDEHGNFINDADIVWKIADEELPKYFTKKDAEHSAVKTEVIGGLEHE